MNSLRGVAGVVARRRWLVIVAVAMAATVAVVLSVLSTNVYAATATVTVPARTPSDTSAEQASDAATEAAVIRSTDMRVDVARRLGDRAPLVSGVRARPVGKSRVVAITTESARPEIARDAANTFATAYVEKRRAEIAAARAASSATAIPAPLANAVQVVEPATLPADPVRPRTVFNGFLATIVGLFVGIGAALLFERFDDRIHSGEDAEAIADAPVLVSIPADERWANRRKARLVTVEDPAAPASEAYRRLRTNIRWPDTDEAHTLLVTSAGTGVGKSAVATNLAVALARSGRRVVCVDCDLRQPRVHEFFDVPSTTGFTSVLLGDHPLSTTMQELSVGAGRLRVLPAGPLPPNPAELLDTGRVPELLKAVGAGADVVILDAPSLLVGTDALTLSSAVDSVLLVVAAEGTTRTALVEAMDLLDGAHVEVVGIVYNGVGRATRPSGERK